MYEGIKNLKLEKRGTILVITMDNPPMNSPSPEDHTELSQIFELINHDRETDVVVLTGAGEKAFSAGGDIKRMMERYENNDHAMWYYQMLEARHIVESMLRLEKPLIGRINGHAMGLGATLASLCDITYMMAKAKIADTHVNIGMTAGDGGSLTWPLLMGFPKAKYHLRGADRRAGGGGGPHQRSGRDFRGTGREGLWPCRTARREPARGAPHHQAVNQPRAAQHA